MDNIKGYVYVIPMSLKTLIMNDTLSFGLDSLEFKCSSKRVAMITGSILNSYSQVAWSVNKLNEFSVSGLKVLTDLSNYFTQISNDLEKYDVEMKIVIDYVNLTYVDTRDFKNNRTVTDVKLCDTVFKMFLDALPQQYFFNLPISDLNVYETCGVINSFILVKPAYLNSLDTTNSLDEILKRITEGNDIWALYFNNTLYGYRFKIYNHELNTFDYYDISDKAIVDSNLLSLFNSVLPENIKKILFKQHNYYICSEEEMQGMICVSEIDKPLKVVRSFINSKLTERGA